VQLLAVALGRLSPRAQTRVVRFTQIVLEVHTKSARDDTSTQAAALTFATFLSLLPLLAFGLWATVSLGAGTEWFDRLLAEVPALTALTETQARELVRIGPGLGLTAAAVVLFTASGIANRAQDVLGRIFEQPPRAFVSRLRAVVATVFLLVVLAASVVGSAALAAIRIPGLPSWLSSFATRAMLLPITFAAILVVYYVLTPARAVPLRRHVPGAIVMTIGLAVLQAVGTALVARTITRASALYGTIGTVFGLVLFLRLVAWLFLYGAELTSVLARGSPAVVRTRPVPARARSTRDPAGGTGRW
jgi:membrane protein